MESRSHEKKDRLICFEAFSKTRQTGRSAESIPRIFGKFKNGSSLDDSSFRRSRSFSLPRVLKRDKEDKQNFSLGFTFGTKTKQKETRSSQERSLVKRIGQNHNRKRLNGEQSYQKNDTSSSEQNKVVIPTICIQTPEEVNLIIKLHQITMDDSAQLCSTHDRENHTECPKQSTEKNATLLCKTSTADNSDKPKVLRRKRSASWSGDLNQISSDAALKHSISWSAFFLSDTSRETDLCSTEL